MNKINSPGSAFTAAATTASFLLAMLFTSGANAATVFIDPGSVGGEAQDFAFTPTA